MSLTTVSYMVPEKFKERLDHEAEQQYMSVSALVRQILAAHFKVQDADVVIIGDPEPAPESA